MYLRGRKVGSEWRGFWFLALYRVFCFLALYRVFCFFGLVQGFLVFGLVQFSCIQNNYWLTETTKMFKFISKLLRLLGLQCVIELKQESKVQHWLIPFITTDACHCLLYLKFVTTNKFNQQWTNQHINWFQLLHIKHTFYFINQLYNTVDTCYRHLVSRHSGYVDVFVMSRILSLYIVYTISRISQHLLVDISLTSTCFVGLKHCSQALI